MRRVAEDVFHVPLSPRDGVNAYLLGDVVVDAGTKGAAKRLIKALKGHAVGAHALTHGHPDHAGGSKRLAEAFEVPVWVGERDRADVESGRPAAAETWARPAVARLSNYEPVALAPEGDVLFNMNLLTTVPGLREPPAILTRDPRLNRQSARRLAALEPELALFGHGPPLRDPAALTAFAAELDA